MSNATAQCLLRTWCCFAVTGFFIPLEYENLLKIFAPDSVWFIYFQKEETDVTHADIVWICLVLFVGVRKWKKCGDKHHKIHSSMKIKTKYKTNKTASHNINSPNYICNNRVSK